MGQLYWPETVGVSRYSIPSHADHHHVSSSSPSKTLLRQTNEQRLKLLEIAEDNESSSNEIQQFFDGLDSLDEKQLDQMIETDLVSSNG